jgi:hypothetical protein
MSAFCSSSRPSRYIRRGGRHLLAATAALLAAASLSAKAVKYGAGTKQDDKLRVEDFLTDGAAPNSSGQVA